MPTIEETNIFKKGSKTYFYSSLFFPKEVKDDVFTLYAFVRTADDYVDILPQRRKKFLQFKTDTKKAFAGKEVHNQIIKRFVAMCRKNAIPQSWVMSFLNSMEMDLKKHTYHTYEELESYMYGSAEVIGLMMAALLHLPEKSYKYAALQGKAMQLLNFIRDVQEDIQLGRQYIPTRDLQAYKLPSLSEESALAHKQAFKQLVYTMIKRYIKLQQQAEAGYHFIPKRYRIPIKTAAQMYLYTAQVIQHNPLIIFKKKVKPSASKIVLTAVKNVLL